MTARLLARAAPTRMACPCAPTLTTPTSPATPPTIPLPTGSATTPPIQATGARAAAAPRYAPTAQRRPTERSAPPARPQADPRAGRPQRPDGDRATRLRVHPESGNLAQALVRPLSRGTQGAADARSRSTLVIAVPARPGPRNGLRRRDLSLPRPLGSWPSLFAQGALAIPRLDTRTPWRQPPKGVAPAILCRAVEPAAERHARQLS